MQYQYASFISLVLHDVHGGCPIFPFDPSTGNNGNHAYHYHPTVTVLEQAGLLGYAIMHYQDNDSRRVCCLQCEDAVLVDFPSLLTDAVTQGLAAWGGKVLTANEALTLVQYLQPTREETFEQLDEQGQPETITRTYGAVSLSNGLLTRTVTEE